MDSDFEQEAAFEGPRSSETPAAFSARLDLLAEVGPVLQHLASEGWAVSVESSREPSDSDHLGTDFVLQYGDARLRVILFPEEPLPLNARNVERLQQFIMAHPDTDGVVVVAGDDALTTSILDVYDIEQAQARPIDEIASAPLREAVARFFSSHLSAVEFPDFKQVVTLPRIDLLAEWLNAKVLEEFKRVSEQNVRIPEKIAALESLSDSDRVAVARLLVKGLRGDEVTLAPLVGDEDD